jgi:hypothetical protein
MRAPRYLTFAEFEREEIRPNLRIGWSMDEIESSDAELDFDQDPFEAQLEAAEEEEEAEQDDE